ncbi:MAG: hypothetical protein WCZ89_10390, partial [Phycisphaerae bacterium]
VTADLYGTKHLGVNYGWMFSAYGAGGLAGPFLAAYLMKVVRQIPYQITDAGGNLVERMFPIGNYRPAFLASGIACIAAAVIVSLALRPAKQVMPAQIAAVKGELDGQFAKEE